MTDMIQISVGEEVDLLCAGLGVLQEEDRADLAETGDIWARLGELMMTGQADVEDVCEQLRI